MYYLKRDSDSITVHESETGQYHFSIPLRDKVDSFNLSGDTLSINYDDGRLEVYDVDARSRIR